MNGTTKRLYRSRSNRIFAGIAGGLANYFNFDSTVIRLILLLLLFVGGFPILLLYLVALLFIPSQPSGEVEHIDEKEKQWLANRRGVIRTLATVLVVILIVGVIFFAGSMFGSMMDWDVWDSWRWGPR